LSLFHSETVEAWGKNSERFWKRIGAELIKIWQNEKILNLFGAYKKEFIKLFNQKLYVAKLL
jgi:hypothetical protein